MARTTVSVLDPTLAAHLAKRPPFHCTYCWWFGGIWLSTVLYWFALPYRRGSRCGSRQRRFPRPPLVMRISTFCLMYSYGTE